MQMERFCRTKIGLIRLYILDPKQKEDENVEIRIHKMARVY
jgi:hypothetical protein